MNDTLATGTHTNGTVRLDDSLDVTVRLNPTTEPKTISVKDINGGPASCVLTKPIYATIDHVAAEGLNINLAPVGRSYPHLQTSTSLDHTSVLGRVENQPSIFSSDLSPPTKEDMTNYANILSALGVKCTQGAGDPITSYFDAGTIRRIVIGSLEK